MKTVVLRTHQYWHRDGTSYSGHVLLTTGEAGDLARALLDAIKYQDEERRIPLSLTEKKSYDGGEALSAFLVTGRKTKGLPKDEKDKDKHRWGFDT